MVAIEAGKIALLFFKAKLDLGRNAEQVPISLPSGEIELINFIFPPFVKSKSAQNEIALKSALAVRERHSGGNAAQPLFAPAKTKRVELVILVAKGGAFTEVIAAERERTGWADPPQ